MSQSVAGFFKRYGRIIGVGCCLLAAGYILWSAGLPDSREANAVLPFTPGQTPVAPEVGAFAPPIEAVDIAGKPLSLAGLQGSPVVVNFWATMCGPCIVEMPMLNTIYDKYRADGLHIIGIDANEPPSDVLIWKTQFDLDYNLIIDNTGQLSHLYRVRGLPSTYLVGRDGIITQVIYGPVNAATFEATIRDLLRKAS